MQKFLVVVDQTPECMKALRFASKRAARTDSGVSLLYIIEPDEFQHWQSVADAMRAEKIEAAETRLVALCDEVRATTGVMPDFAIREGAKTDQVLEHLKSDPNVRILVLGAGTDGAGPGPLVTSLGGQLAGTMPVPVTIVPGSLTNEEIDAVC